MYEVGVVYELKCRECDKKGIERVYTGETGRELKIRCKEHVNVNKDRSAMSDVGRHNVEEQVKLV
jgi:hypothetical protein